MCDDLSPSASVAEIVLLLNKREDEVPRTSIGAAVFIKEAEVVGATFIVEIKEMSGAVAVFDDEDEVTVSEHWEIESEKNVKS